MHISADSSAGKVTVSGRLASGDAKFIETEIRSSIPGLQQVKDVEVRVKIG